MEIPFDANGAEGQEDNWSVRMHPIFRIYVPVDICQLLVYNGIYNILVTGE